ncbi:hypothetical protein [Polaromonas sp. LjRoot131]|jgi:hypothetical protein|uniref:hypothetical protein n=1 Tax=Polaromonas sp. LjRoot131 TaxID=3342262 RepID=UPI003ECF35AC
MRFLTFLKTGVEVLHLGGQHWQSNAWPIDHWKANPGRWRLFTPAIDAFLNEDLMPRDFGTSIEQFLLILEVADFKAWGEGVAFTGPDGFTRYKHKTREVWSVGRINWPEVQHLPARLQLLAFGQALQAAIANVAVAKRKPKDFATEAFGSAVAARLASAKVSQLSHRVHAQHSET